MAERADARVTTLAWGHRLTALSLLVPLLTPPSSAANSKEPLYRNPVLPGDYSDPDAVAVGDDFYLVASSFSNVPGLPVLHSRDLVTWTLVGHALPRLLPDGHFATPRRGGGVWAPAIVYRAGEFRIYYADPDRGIFVVTARNPAGPWTRPVLVDATRGAIDPVPFWDDDGSAWLAHAYAHSRSGIRNVIVLKRMNADGTRTVDAGVRILDGDRLPPARTSLGWRPWQTTEGPKLYKRDGWYWLFVPSGSVKGGWQGVFRARRITGPWEGRNVLDQGRTAINGPHQGAWLRTTAGEDWFLHFQDTDSYGRRVFLEPMHWRDGWPVIGEDLDGDGIGQPVLRCRMPRTGARGVPAPATITEDFIAAPSADWQWQSNPQDGWVGQAPPGWLRLTSASTPVNLWEAGNLLSHKLPGLRFAVTAKLRFAPERIGERAGLAMFGSDYAWVGAERDTTGIRIVRVDRLRADSSPGTETRVTGPTLASAADLWLRLEAEPATVADPPPDFSPYWPSMLRSTHARTRFLYSLDGVTFTPIGDSFTSRPGRWVGAQFGLFAQAPSGTPAFTANSTGYADFDWVRITP